MRYRGKQLIPWCHGTSCLYRFNITGTVRGTVYFSRTYSTQQHPPSRPKDDIADKPVVPIQERAVATIQNLTDLGKQWGQKSVSTASQWGQKSMTTASNTVNYWWERYEEFVGLNEVRDAQSQVTEAERAFMVARGMVREAHGSLEALQVRLKEVRDRLDRVSREEAHYLELATLEHKLLQEERRLRTAYENAESAEREKFALFSAGVRASHEKERTRAERTKNWSVIGSVLGALIGVMGSTYINRVRLQELKTLLLEAQKGPVSLQEAIKVQAGMHKTQQQELRGLIDTLRVTLQHRAAQVVAEKEDVKKPVAAPVPVPEHIVVPPPHQPSPSASETVLKEILLYSQKAQSLVEGIQPQLGQLEQSVGKVESELLAVQNLIETYHREEKQSVVISQQDSQMFVCDTKSVMQGLDQTEKRLEASIGQTTMYNTVLAYGALAVTVPALYILFRGV
ncbi:mitochondrial potassium channel [Coregonus clupeaformis]|uniref:mitochondrial potassium channel n=1 Tax=Coregonus clupeaformis TaxID=59861 RepID=UPI001BE050E1|nr:mitochondrial potassium channel [Coregonus clupeaformis]XP_041747854.1 mitochondrial potassium channel [Coregonus clupeaformis]XP_041747855.1 mitochondrial potassium channel [Coregonus clupeaformis]XP_041747856.1 mitochondrial potassium channel [Coregonus clupeaformis]